ncbi:Pyruvate carboxylase [Saccharopolyspora flava]|uniref:acetyl-CoA carboxylase n=1 Tax=Saccharopolyspora flava TaxID=95161 RepID=A0A1I6SE03_9PSEU|nr:Pyruvate carboxylase [Saccharopolyspora flava]
MVDDERGGMSGVLVANRGEIAVRVARAIAELGWRSVAVHPADDADAAHVAAADEAVPLPGTGVAAYLDGEALVAAALASGCVMIHPGYGFLSENAGFARRCAKAGLTFVGPRPEVLDVFGDKSAARSLARSLGVPVLPGTDGPTTLDQAREFFAEHGPVMLKALAGGGGRGMREVREAAELPEAFERCRSEATTAFGSGELYVERLLAASQHIEVQVLGDGTGAVQHCGERDCTIQRRHQKLVEVAPSPRLSPPMREELLVAALRLTRDVDYGGAGTVEFLVDGEEFFFIEANPRLQVEHTVTEEITGVDLVKAQLRLAGGATLEELGLTEPPRPRGTAIQSRVNLETLGADGLARPSSGAISAFDPPTGPGVRVDTCGRTGQNISPQYDSLVAKVICHAEDFTAATARTRAALDAFRIEGVPSNLDLLRGLVRSAEFTENRWDTSLLDRYVASLPAPDEPAAASEEVVAPMAGTVLAVEAEPGATVAAGTAVVVLEAMKMEHVVRAATALTVEQVLVAPGEVVGEGTTLLRGTPSEHDEARVPEPVEEDWAPEVAEIERRRALALEMGGAEKVRRQRDSGRLTARERIDALADAGSFREIGALTGFSDATGHVVPANFVAGTARIDGRKVVLGVDDFTVRGGSGDGAVHDKQIFAEQHAHEIRLPVVRLLDGASGGGSVKMIRDAGYTYVPVNPGWDAVVDNLSVVPVVAACLGPTVGLGAARLVMSHLSVLVSGVGQLFTAGPPVVRAATGEDLTKEQLGGVEVHRGNGTVERVVADETEAFDVVRRFLSYLPTSAFETPPVAEPADPPERREESLLSAVPRNPRRPYAIEPVLEAIFDAGSVFRYAEYGDGTRTALARLDGHPVGVIAADPAAGATMSVEGALAITRLVDLCETFHLPLVSLTDQAGMSIGGEAERRATIRHGARALTAVYQARVPQAEIIVRRVYGVGGAGIINRHRASRSWAWPSGDWGSLPTQGGVEAAFRAQISASADPAAEVERIARELAELTSPFRTAERFGVQDIIDPRESRPLLCDWVRDAYRVLPSLTGRPSFGTRP